MVAILLNQPRPRAAMAAAKLVARGFTTVELSCHTLSPVPEGQQQLAVLPLASFDRVVFVSPSAVTFAEPVLRNRLGANQVAAIGQGTATVLLESGLVSDDHAIIRPRQVPFDSAALMQLAPMQPGAIDAMLIIAGTQARTDWIDAASASGIDCTTLTIYESRAEPPGPTARDQLEELQSQEADAVLVVGSVSEFQGLQQWLATLPSGPRLLAWLQGQAAIAPHGRIAQQVQQSGWQRVNTTRTGQTLLDAALELAAL